MSKTEPCKFIHRVDKRYHTTRRADKEKDIKLKEVGEANTNLRTKIKEIGVLIDDPELLAKRYHQRIKEIEQLKQEQEEQLKQRRNPERDLDQEQRPRNRGMRM